MKIELFYLEGCPNLQPTMDRLRQVLQEYGFVAPIIEVRVGAEEFAKLRFLGSPTIRVNGVDIEPSARRRTDFGIMCRTYEGSGGVPSEDLIRSAIAETAADAST